MTRISKTIDCKYILITWTNYLISSSRDSLKNESHVVVGGATEYLSAVSRRLTVEQFWN